MIIILIISTFSIVAVDSETGEVGIAVASKVFDVGYIVPWLEAEYGGVASQAYANPFLGPWILSSLSRGKPAGEALRIALSRDTMPEVRQVGVVDRHGYSAAHTGRDCLAWAGHRTGRWVSVQGNILTGPEVVDSMFAVFIRTKGPLAERLLAALEAGDRAGGDRRGRQSAALYVVRKRGGYQGADDRLVDLKVVDNPEPIKELRRLYDSWQYTFLAAAYLRLANEEGKDVFLRRARKLAETALVSTLKDPYLYNNLAWEFALKRIYPDLTLKLAHRAHELAPEDANIMDTMAEAYYAAGNWRMAIHWEKKALEKEPENEFFKKQLRRFEEGGK